MRPIVRPKVCGVVEGGREEEVPVRSGTGSGVQGLYIKTILGFPSTSLFLNKPLELLIFLFQNLV